MSCKACKVSCCIELTQAELAACSRYTILPTDRIAALSPLPCHHSLLPTRLLPDLLQPLHLLPHPGQRH